jgi:hypothetical protein
MDTYGDSERWLHGCQYILLFFFINYAFVSSGYIVTIKVIFHRLIGPVWHIQVMAKLGICMHVL